MIEKFCEDLSAKLNKCITFDVNKSNNIIPYDHYVYMVDGNKSKVVTFIDTFTHLKPNTPEYQELLTMVSDEMKIT